MDTTTADQEQAGVDVEHDAPESHDLKEEGQSPQPTINVGRKERLGSVVAGSLLTMLGIRRRSNFGAVMALVGGSLIHRGVTGYCKMNTLMGRDSAHGGDAPDPSEYFEHGVHVEEAVTIDKSPEELFTFWRNFENLPQFMDHLKSVQVTGENTSHWVAKAPAGMSVEWDAEVINELPNSLIAWRSLGGSQIDNTGSVRFITSQEGNGTEVRVVLDYLPPAGQVGRWIAKLFGEEPAQQVRADLKRFKEVMEASDDASLHPQTNGRH